MNEETQAAPVHRTMNHASGKAEPESTREQRWGRDLEPMEAALA
jgi:hypothetical protein